MGTLGGKGLRKNSYECRDYESVGGLKDLIKEFFQEYQVFDF